MYVFEEQKNGHRIVNYLFQCEFFLSHVPCHDQPNLPPLAQEAHLVINPSASGSWTIHSDGQLLSPNKEQTQYHNIWVKKNSKNF